MTVTLLDVLAAGRARQASVVAETAGSVVLALADQVVHLPRRLTATAIELLPEGGLRLDGGEATSEAVNEQALRLLLHSLLGLTRGTAPGLARVGVRPARGNLAALVHELEVALVPVNRAAGRRALARLHRETVRALAAGIPIPAVQWARSVAEAVWEARPSIVEPAAAAEAPRAESPPLPAVAGAGEAPVACARQDPMPSLPVGPAAVDSTEGGAVAARLDDVTDRVPMAMLDEEGEILPQRTVGLARPDRPHLSADGARNAGAAATPSSRANESTEPLPALAPARPVTAAGPNAPVAVEAPPVAPAEEITVPMPIRARRNEPDAGRVAPAGGSAEARGLHERRGGASSPGLAGETSDPEPVPARAEAPAPEVPEIDGKGDASAGAPSSGVDRAGRVERSHDVSGGLGAGSDWSAPALPPAAGAEPWPFVTRAERGGASHVTLHEPRRGSALTEVEVWLAALDGRWDESCVPAAAAVPAHGAESPVGGGRGAGEPPVSPRMLAPEAPGGIAGEEESIGWVASQVVLPLPGVVTAEVDDEVPALGAAEHQADAESTPQVLRSRSSWRVRPATGGFAPVASDVDDLVARFATQGSGAAAVAEGLAAFVDLNHSPVPAPARPRLTEGAARRPRGSAPTLSTPRPARGGDAVARTFTALAGRGR